MSIYQVGDRVFYKQKGWGTITVAEFYPDDYPLFVKFDNGLNYFFTIDGYHNKKELCPSLSFTEYTFKGFSQVRPRPDLKAGDLIWVKDQGTEWLLKRFFAWTAKGVFVRFQEPSDFESAMIMEFPIYSLECPIKS